DELNTFEEYVIKTGKGYDDLIEKRKELEKSRKDQLMYEGGLSEDQANEMILLEAIEYHQEFRRQLQETQDKHIEVSGTLADSMKLGFKRSLGEARSWQQEIISISESMSQAFNESIAGYLLGVFKGEADSFESFMADTFSNIADMFANMVSEMIAEWAIMNSIKFMLDIDGGENSLLGLISGAQGSEKGFGGLLGMAGTAASLGKIGSAASAGYETGGVLGASKSALTATDFGSVVTSGFDKVSSGLSSLFGKTNAATEALGGLDSAANYASMEGVRSLGQSSSAASDAVSNMGQTTTQSASYMNYLGKAASAAGMAVSAYSAVTEWNDDPGMALYDAVKSAAYGVGLFSYGIGAVIGGIMDVLKMVGVADELMSDITTKQAAIFHATSGINPVMMPLTMAVGGEMGIFTLDKLLGGAFSDLGNAMFGGKLGFKFNFDDSINNLLETVQYEVANILNDTSKTGGFGVKLKRETAS
ncbi:MAG: hypothetical protein HQK77_20315, partial [Desulfobacterales bacterium]|nr:hypothetical protein [Desulfobacterales bacterium]